MTIYSSGIRLSLSRCLSLSFDLLSLPASNWLLNQSLQRSITSYLTYRHRPVDSAENPIDLFEYDRMVLLRLSSPLFSSSFRQVFLCFAHLAQMTVNHEQEIFSAISLIRLPSLISLGSIMGRLVLPPLDSSDLLLR
jgi:hypothetical protein